MKMVTVPFCNWQSFRTSLCSSSSSKNLSRYDKTHWTGFDGSVKPFLLNNSSAVKTKHRYGSNRASCCNISLFSMIISSTGLCSTIFAISAVRAWVRYKNSKINSADGVFRWKRINKNECWFRVENFKWMLRKLSKCEQNSMRNRLDS